MRNKLLKILSLFTLILSPFVLIADDCESCEEGDPICGGDPSGDVMEVYLGE